ncbi:MAG: type IX secretion system membrane protein PorP/SprF, partial [Flavobacteriaceae bacterium]|nr:type IX secretion system membrane protein PorP/SprF [Flavobacteriaceae bacterium]
KNNSGLLEGARMLTLARATKPGERDVQYSGSLVLDLPKLGWLQGGYHSYYGLSGGIGFNLNKRISLGYSIEKGLEEERENLGLTHELNFAYSFQPKLTEDRVDLENKESLADNKNKEQQEFLELDEEIAKRDAEIAKLKEALKENDGVLAEVIYRQDSLERSRNADLERRFAQVLKLAKKENDPSFKEEAKDIFFESNDGVNKVATIDKQKKLENKINKSTKLKQKNTTSTPVKKNKNTNIVAQKSKKKNKIPNSIKKSNTKSAEAVAFEKAAKSKGVRSRRLTNVEGVDKGYYMVANVYKGNYYFNKFMEDLKARGHEPKYFVNPKNGMKYVYLEKFNDWQDAMDAYTSKMDGNYKQDMWVMNVDNGSSGAASSKRQPVLQKNVVTDKSKKIRKFDQAKDETAVAANRTYTKSNAVRKKPLNKVRVVATNDVGAGYYIVANVFSVKRNADNFVRKL